MHITDTENSQVYFGFLQSFHSFFMNAILITTSDIGDHDATSKLDLGISGICYMQTMLKLNFFTIFFEHSFIIISIIFFSDYGVTKRHSRSEDANERNSGPM